MAIRCTKKETQAELWFLTHEKITKDKLRNNNQQQFTNKTPSQTKIAINIKKKLFDNDALIIKSEKGNTIIIMQTNED